MIFADRTAILYKMKEKKLISEAAVNCAEFLCGLENDTSDDEKQALAAVSALLFEWGSAGSICLTEEDVVKFAAENRNDLPDGFPDWKKMTTALSGSSVCTCDPASDPRPIVSADGRIYFYKYWLYEDSLAGKVLKLSQGKGKFAGFSDKINAVFDKLFDEESSEQKNAAETVIGNRFSVITGGPGTGKTTTVAKILAGILSVCPEARVILAAPTGKAAARMTEALIAATEKMERSRQAAEAETLGKIKSLKGLTIHKILGWKFGMPDKNMKNPIHADLIIIDEVSMVDLTMFSDLTDALYDETSLVLLGDKDQLASVDVGNVLGDICSAAEAGLFERNIAAKLTKSHRFEKHPAIGRLAEAVNGQKRADEVIRICKEEADLAFTTQTVQEIAGKAAERYRFLSDTNLKPDEILDRLNSFKVLCPSKEDSFGVAKLNEAIEKALGKEGADAFYSGRPIMVTKNDYANTGLVNGDCGVILGKKAYFKTERGGSTFPVAVLPPVETVYAMTIHKSQGSEYRSVLAVLPEKDMPILTKELLYTAITRAREKVEITAKESVLEYTLKNSAARNSGFENALKKLKNRQ